MILGVIYVRCQIGFTVLNSHLAHWGFTFNDGKLMTPTCGDMGFRQIPRTEFFFRAPARGRAQTRPAGALAGGNGRCDAGGLAAGVAAP